MTGPQSRRGCRSGRRVALVIGAAIALASFTACLSAVDVSEPKPAVLATATPDRFLPHVEPQPTPTPVETATPVENEASEDVVLPTEDASGTIVPDSTEQPEATSSDVAAPAAAAAPSVVEYTVAAGDTLLGVALAHGVPMAAIQLSSELGPETTVRVGQVLRVPQAAMWADASPFWILHQVVAGETLSELAAQLDLGLEALLSANGLTDADLISVGQLLVLPLDGPAEVVVSAPIATETPIPAPTAAIRVDVVAETATVAPTAPSAPVAPPEDVSALAGEIFRLLNEQRAAYGLPPLAWNETLARAAQLHANDCYERGWCGHTGSDGSTYKERIIHAGYDPVRWSECWAWYGTPELAVAMWMDEVPPNDPHRRTILSDYLVEVGVGVMPGNGHGYYFIADFGTPR